jgi:hypothetical protein
MHPDEVRDRGWEAPVAAPKGRPPALLVAGVLHVLGMLAVVSALVHLGPLTLTLSVAGGGLLLAAAGGIYLWIVVHDLRRRRIL